MYGMAIIILNCNSYDAMMICWNNAILTINAPVIMKVWDVIFFMQAKHIIGHFKGFFMEIKKVEISMKNPIRPQLPIPVEAPPPSGK